METTKVFLMNDLAGILSMYRQRAKLTQEDLGKRVGVSTTTIRNWESGISMPKSENLKKLIELFLEIKVFTTGFELEEAKDLWLNANLSDSFDQKWFMSHVELYRPSNNGIFLSNPDHKQVIEKPLGERIGQTYLEETKADLDFTRENFIKGIKNYLVDQEALDRAQKRELEKRERLVELKSKENATERAIFELQKEKIYFALELAQKIATIHQPGATELLYQIAQTLNTNIVGLLNLSDLHNDIVNPTKFSKSFEHPLSGKKEQVNRPEL